LHGLLGCWRRWLRVVRAGGRYGAVEAELLARSGLLLALLVLAECPCLHLIAILLLQEELLVVVGDLLFVRREYSWLGLGLSLGLLLPQAIVVVLKRLLLAYELLLVPHDLIAIIWRWSWV